MITWVVSHKHLCIRISVKRTISSVVWISFLRFYCNFLLWSETFHSVSCVCLMLWEGYWCIPDCCGFVYPSPSQNNMLKWGNIRSTEVLNLLFQVNPDPGFPRSGWGWVQKIQSDTWRSQMEFPDSNRLPYSFCWREHDLRKNVWGCGVCKCFTWY